MCGRKTKERDVAWSQHQISFVFKGPHLWRWTWDKEEEENNPLLASKKRITIGKIFTVRHSTRMKYYRRLHFSQTSKILPLPIFLLYFEVGLSAQI